MLYHCAPMDTFSEFGMENRRGIYKILCQAMLTTTCNKMSALQILRLIVRWFTIKDWLVYIWSTESQNWMVLGIKNKA